MSYAARWYVLSLLVSGVVAGCGEAATGDVDSDLDLSAFQTLSVEPIATIGSLNDPLQALNRPGDIVIGGDGTVYIAQPDNQQIRVYDARGAFVRTVGRHGEGPGEFSRPAFVGIADDTLYVTDNGLQRVSFFSLDGQFLGSRQWATQLRTERRPGGGGGVFYEATAPQIRLSADTGVVEVSAGAYVAAAGPGGMVRDPVLRHDPWDVPTIRVDASGEAIDTIAKVSRQMISFGVPLNGEMRYYSVPFRDDVLSALMRDGSGVAFVNRPAAETSRGTFEITLVGPYRDTVFTRTIAYDPLPVSAGAVRRVTEALASARTQGADASAIESSLRANDLLPSSLPPVTAITSGQDGSLWLRVEIDSGEESEWIALNGGGEARGSVRLPAGDSIAAARDETIVTVFTDELDVPYVRTYRVRAP